MSEIKQLVEEAKQAVVETKNPAPAPAPEMLSEADKSSFELARMKQKLALAAAEKALAQNETAELNFKYLLLQLYVKYGLDTTVDALTEDGKIVRNALLNQGNK
jgi:hypothetical protein